MKFILSVYLILLMSSCTSFKNIEMHGADEFVMDSYKIQRGKEKILEMQGDEISHLSICDFQDYQIHIDENDFLNISFFHPKREDFFKKFESLSNQGFFCVKDGKICLPDIGVFQVKGMTIKQAEKKIQNCILNEIDDAKVFVSFKKHSNFVEVSGLCQNPKVFIDGKTKLYDVLVQAKILPEANLFSSYLLRKGQVIKSIDFFKLLKEGDLSQNIVMRKGDFIYIADPNSSKIMVMGEVGLCRIIPTLSGKIPVKEAITAAKGIPYTGSSSIYVIRGSIKDPKIFHLAFEHIMGLPNTSMLLMPGDVVYVSSKPITKWNRFISQILPTIGTAEMLSKGVKQVGIFLP